MLSKLRTGIQNLFYQPPEPEPEPTLTEEPWRKIQGWGRKIRCDLKEYVAGLAPQPPREMHVPFYNILLTGQIKAGKSSFYNSLNNVFTERVVANAEVGEVAESLTKEFRIYEIKPTPNSDPLAWRILDTMGLQKDPFDGSDVGDILKAVDGHFPDRFVFDKIRESAPGYITKPSLAAKVHCVAVVVNAKELEVMGRAMWDKLRNLRKALINKSVPTYILLTHIDEACEEVHKDVSKVFNSIAIQKLVHEISRQLLSLPENQIFPVKNYRSEIQLDDNMDILLLYALRQMLYSAQGCVKTKAEEMPEKSKICHIV